MAHVIVTEGLCDDEFLKRHMDGFEDFRTFIESWTPERAAGHVDPDAIRLAARTYATRGPLTTVDGLGHAFGALNLSVRRFFGGR